MRILVYILSVLFLLVISHPASAKNVEEYLQSAYEALEQGHPDQALDILEQGYAEHPGSVGMALGTAEIYHNVGEYVAAIANYLNVWKVMGNDDKEMLKALHSHLMDAYYKIAVEHQITSELCLRVFYHYEQLLKINIEQMNIPQDKSFLEYFLSQYDLLKTGAVVSIEGSDGVSVDLPDDGISQEEKLAAMKVIEDKLGSSPESRKVSFARMEVKLDPEDASAKQGLIDFVSKMGPTSERQKLMNQGIELGLKDNFDEAIAIFEQVAREYPNKWTEHYYLAKLYMSKQEWGKAVKAYMRAQELGLPENSDDIKPAIQTFLPRDIELSYEAVFKPEVKVIKVHGNPGGDEILMSDVLKGIEKMEVGRYSLPERIVIEFLRVQENGEMWIEKWSLSGADNPRDYWVTYDSTPPPDFPFKIDIKISEKEEQMPGDKTLLINFTDSI